MEKVTEELGFPLGEHLSLAYQIESVLSTKFDESMNINGYVSAFLADQGYSPIEVYRIFSAVVLSGVTACYADTADRLEGSFAPLKTSDVIYKGAKSRAVTLK
jgi:citrate synthase